MITAAAVFTVQEKFKKRSETLKDRDRKLVSVYWNKKMKVRDRKLVSVYWNKKMKVSLCFCI